MKYSVEVATTICILCIALGLVLSKIQTKLGWREIIILEYKNLILTPILKIISNRISKKQASLNKLYKFRNKLLYKIYKKEPTI